MSIPTIIRGCALKLITCAAKTGLAAVIVLAAGLGLHPDIASALPGGRVVSATFTGSVSSPDGQCQDVTVPVSLWAGQVPELTVAGTYCTPDSWQQGPQEVDVLTPGATYDQSYWNWPVDPDLYSYVDKTLAAGRATFDYDRIGTGASSHPESTEITIYTEAYVLHQIVGWLRSDLGYRQVNSIGHSLGSVIAIQEAGSYRDVSRLVVTGLLHWPGGGPAFPTTLEA